MTGAILAKEHTRCPQCRGAVRLGEAIAEHKGDWYHDECCPTELSEVETMRRALRQVGFPAEELDDENIATAVQSLYRACVDFGVGVDRIFGNEPLSTGERLRRLADFADAIDPLIEQEAKS